MARGELVHESPISSPRPRMAGFGAAPDGPPPFRHRAAAFYVDGLPRRGEARQIVGACADGASRPPRLRCCLRVGASERLRLGRRRGEQYAPRSAPMPTAPASGGSLADEAGEARQEIALNSPRATIASNGWWVAARTRISTWIVSSPCICTTRALKRRQQRRLRAWREVSTAEEERPTAAVGRTPSAPCWSCREGPSRGRRSGRAGRDPATVDGDEGPGAPGASRGPTAQGRLAPALRFAPNEDGELGRRDARRPQVEEGVELGVPASRTALSRRARPSLQIDVLRRVPASSGRAQDVESVDDDVLRRSRPRARSTAGSRRTRRLAVSSTIHSPLARNLGGARVRRHRRRSESGRP